MFVQREGVVEVGKKSRLHVCCSQSAVSVCSVATWKHSFSRKPPRRPVRCRASGKATREFQARIDTVGHVMRSSRSRSERSARAWQEVVAMMHLEECPKLPPILVRGGVEILPHKAEGCPEGVALNKCLHELYGRIFSFILVFRCH